MSEHGAEDGLAWVPLPDISTAARYAHSQDPAWTELSPEETAARLSQWSSDPEAALADVPTEACLAAVTQLSNQLSNDSKVVLAASLQHVLHKGTTLLCNTKQSALKKHNSVNDPQWTLGLLAAAFLTSQCLYLPALPTTTTRAGGRTVQPAGSTQSHQAAYKCLLAVCRTVQQLLGEHPQGLQLHAAVAKVVKAVVIHHVTGQAAGKSTAGKSKQATEQHPMMLTKVQLQELLTPLLLFTHAPPLTSLPVHSMHSADQDMVDSTHPAAHAGNGLPYGSTITVHQGTAQCTELLQQVVQELVTAVTTLGAVGGSTAATNSTAGTASAGVMSVAVNLVVRTLNSVAQQNGQQAIGLLMEVTSLLPGQHEGTAATKGPVVPAERVMMLVQILAGTTAGFGDPLVAGLLLRKLQACSNHSKAAVRKLVLDVAALALDACTVEGAQPLVTMAAVCLQRGSEDRDANVRAHALAACMEHLPALWAQHAQWQQQQVRKAVNQEHNDQQLQSSVWARNSHQSLILCFIVPAVCTRMLDSAKSLRLKAMQLLLQLLSSSVSADVVQPAVLAAAQKAIARSVLGPLCCLMDARLDGPLHDPSIAQVLDDSLQQVFHHLGEAEVLQQLLAVAIPSSTLPQPAVLGQQAHAALPALSPRLVQTLLQRCQPEDAATACRVWCEKLSTLTSSDQVNSVCKLAQHVPQAGRLAIKQEAVRGICVALAEQPDAINLLAEGCLATKCIPYLQAVFCFTDCVARQSAGQATCTKHSATTSSTCSTSDSLTCEAAILLDLARRLLCGHNLNVATHMDGDLGPEHVSSTSGQLSSADSKEEKAQTCLAWCFRAMRKLVITSAAAAQQQLAMDPAATCKSVNAAAAAAVSSLQSRQHNRFSHTVDGLVLKSMPGLLKRVLDGCQLSVVDAALELLCVCKGAAPHAQRVLWQTEQMLQLHTPPAATAKQHACDGVMDCDVQLSAQQGGGTARTHMEVDGNHESTAARASAGDSTALVPQRQLAIYLLLLGHMAQLYEQERQHALQRALHAKEPARTGSKSINPVSAADSKACDRQANGNKQNNGGTATALGTDAAAAVAAGDGHFNYMAAEEAQQAVQAMAQQYVEQLMGCSAPGTRVPLLAGLLSQGPASLPPGLQVLALRALCPLMKASPHMAAQHQHLVVTCLTRTTPTAAPQTAPMAGQHTAPTAEEHTAAVAKQHTATVAEQQEWSWICEEALMAAQSLMLQHPNTCGGVLLAAVESMLGTLLHSATTPPVTKATMDSSQPFTGPLGEIASAGQHGNVSQQQPGFQQGQCDVKQRVLVRAMAVYVEVLCSNKLQLAGSTWRLLSRCVLCKHEQVKQLACDGLRALLSLLPGHTSAKRSKPKAGPAASKTGAAAAAARSGQQQGPAGVMLLFANCEEQHRQRLVEEVGVSFFAVQDRKPHGLVRTIKQVILGLQLVTDEDLCSDALVLPALQSLALADTAAARAACLTLLSHLTPSAGAVAAVAASVQSQSLGLARMTPTQGLAMLNTLNAFVSRYKPSLSTANQVPPAAAVTPGTLTTQQADGQSTATATDVQSNVAAEVGNIKDLAELDGMRQQAASSKAELSDRVSVDMAAGPGSGRSSLHSVSHTKVLAQLQALAASLQARAHPSGRSSGIPRPRMTSAPRPLPASSTHTAVTPCPQATPLLTKRTASVRNKSPSVTTDTAAGRASRPPAKSRSGATANRPLRRSSLQPCELGTPSSPPAVAAAAAALQGATSMATPVAKDQVHGLLATNLVPAAELGTVTRRALRPQSQAHRVRHQPVVIRTSAKRSQCARRKRKVVSDSSSENATDISDSE